MSYSAYILQERYPQQIIPKSERVPESGFTDHVFIGDPRRYYTTKPYDDLIYFAKEVLDSSTVKKMSEARAFIEITPVINADGNILDFTIFVKTYTKDIMMSLEIERIYSLGKFLQKNYKFNNEGFIREHSWEYDSTGGIQIVFKDNSIEVISAGLDYRPKP